MAMTIRQLAEKLCADVARRRNERIGEPAPTDPLPFAGLPPAEQQPWLDVAEAILAMQGHGGDHADRLRELTLDWDRYTLTLKSDPAWRDDMRRAVVVEMRIEIEHLAAECGLDTHA